MIEGCKAYCAAALAQKCGDGLLTVEQCQAQCTFLPTQTKGFCEAEAGALYQCTADGGFTCLGIDTDGDGKDDQFTPAPKNTCLPETQAQFDCEQNAGCGRFCAAADEAGCGSGCLDACEAKKAQYEMGVDGSCALQYNSFVNCGGQLGVVCEGAAPRPDDFCVDQAFQVAECVAGTDACAIYCTGADLLACGSSNCVSDCTAKNADPTCGTQWASVLDCLTFFGDGACEAGKLVPATEGICSGDRDAYLMCAGSF